MRLELLEGVAAFYSGERVLACAKLRSAQGRWQKLQVPDERLAELLSMGFSDQEVRADTLVCIDSEKCDDQHWATGRAYVHGCQRLGGEPWPAVVPHSSQYAHAKRLYRWMSGVGW